MKESIDEKPPYFSSWNKVYLMVIGNLVFMILLFYLFSVAFR